MNNPMAFRDLIGHRRHCDIINAIQKLAEKLHDQGLIIHIMDREESATVRTKTALGRAYRGLTDGFLLLRNFSVVSPHLIMISLFLRLCSYELGIVYTSRTTKYLRNQGRTKGEGWSTVK